MDRVTRRYAYTGQFVSVSLWDDTAVEGHIVGWGSRVLRIEGNDGTRHEWSNVAVKAVYSM